MSKNTLLLGIVCDHSLSMRSRATDARDDFNAQIERYKIDAKAEDVDVFVSVVRCGVSRDILTEVATYVEQIDRVQPIVSYQASAPNTPLYDAIGEQIRVIKDLKLMNKEAQVMIMVLTDGEENASVKYSAGQIGKMIKELQDTDEWSFTFRIPKGYKRNLVALGVYADNIYEWDIHGGREEFTKSTLVASSATTSYMRDIKLGVKSTKSFYSTNLSDPAVAQQIATMTDISKQVRIFETTGTEDIRPFVERMAGHYLKGSAHYELTKNESAVQDYKQILIQSKKTGQVYAGAEARSILGLPTMGNVKIHPGDHGDYTIYIQSTSVNRKLPGGTKVALWTQGQQPVVAAPAPVAPAKANPAPAKNWPFATKVAAPAPAPAKKTVMVAVATKVDVPRAAANADTLFQLGYKDGRHKRKNQQLGADYATGFAAGKADRPD